MVKSLLNKFYYWSLPAAVCLGLLGFPAEAAAGGTAPEKENPDSLAVVRARWNTRRIQKGIVLKQFHFTDSSLFGSNQFISIVEIDAPRKRRRPGKSHEIRIAAREKLTPVSVFAREEGAGVALNGSFFALGKPYNSVDYLRIGGRELAPNERKGPDRLMHQLGAVAVQDGNLYILKADTSAAWESTVRAEDLLTSGPLLRIGGRDEPLREDSFYVTRHPRTAVGKTAGGKVLFIAVDGRSPQAGGMSLQELQQVFRWLGAADLLNLDGGGSTTLYIRPDLLKGVSQEDGVVNHPTDNRKFDHAGARSVANVLIVK